MKSVSFFLDTLYSDADLIVTAKLLAMTGRIDGSYVAMLVQILISRRFSYTGADLIILLTNKTAGRCMLRMKSVLPNLGL